MLESLFGFLGLPLLHAGALKNDAALLHLSGYTSLGQDYSADDMRWVLMREQVGLVQKRENLYLDT